ncbi:NYN domain-containing protein [Xanthomonas oryzae]|uniref:NYN domain-containing protein n=1 Tax=Xanthomonas oryzae TaxID=347 RepID=UPI003CCFF089
MRHRRARPQRVGHLQLVRRLVGNELAHQSFLRRVKVEDLLEDDFLPAVRQKGVDMRIGIDISSLALKHQVDQIVLFAGDADFVPAAKLARREGIDFVLDPMWSSVADGLLEHIDGMRSVCPRPIPRKPKAE